MSFILDAIKGFGEWIWNGLCAIGNAIVSALTNLFQTIFINPFIGIFNAILNKIREKIKGVIFIVVTVPWMIREARALMKSPSIKGFVKFAVKPLIGYAVSEITYALISPYLRPVTITPPTIPTITPFPSAPAPPPALTDYVRINDYLSLELTGATVLSDYVRIQDTLTLWLITPTGLADSISINDLLSVTLYGMTSLSDSISISDIITLTLE
jgi:hypothetical protein